MGSGQLNKREGRGDFNDTLLAAGMDSEITIETEGEQAQEAIDALLALMVDRFGEGQ